MISRLQAIVVFCALSVLLLTACGGGGGVGMPQPTPTSTASLSPIDSIVEQNYLSAWGVELAIYKHGVLVYQHGYGLRDRGLPEQFEGDNFWGIEQTDQLFHLARERSDRSEQAGGPTTGR